MTPFVLKQADEFRPAPPPALTSEEYTDVFNEVKSLGFINSTTRTADQTQIGKFWNGNIQDFWNEIAQTASLGHNLDLPRTAHLFAQLNFSLADTAIAFFEAKYFYNFWRPVTAIRAADTDGNPETSPNPSWLPLSTNTAPDPSYPSAHSAISAAGAEVLKLELGERFTFDVTSESLAGVTRHFTSFGEAGQEAGLSRIYAGQHFRSDHVAGKELGRKVARDRCSIFGPSAALGKVQQQIDTKRQGALLSAEEQGARFELADPSPLGLERRIGLGLLGTLYGVIVPFVWGRRLPRRDRTRIP